MRDIFLALAVLLFAFLYTTSQKEYASGAQVSGTVHTGGGSDWVHRYSSSLSGQYKENNPNLARRVAGVFMYNSPSDWPFKVSPGTTMAVPGRGPNGIPHV